MGFYEIFGTVTFSVLIGFLAFLFFVVYDNSKEMEATLVVAMVLVMGVYFSMGTAVDKKKAQVNKLVEICIEHNIKLPKEFKDDVYRILKEKKTKEAEKEIKNYIKGE